MFHNNQNGKIFIFLAFDCLGLEFFSIDRINFTWNFIFSALDSFLFVSVQFFLAELLYFQQRTHFKFWLPISRKPNILGRLKKKNKLKQKGATYMYILRIYEYALPQNCFFFNFSIS